MRIASPLTLLCGLVVLASALSSGNIAHAENLGPGGGTRIIVGDEVVGPYRLLVTVSPEPAQAGIVTFAVRVSDPESDAKVLDADVTVELTHSEDGSQVNGPATHKDAGNAIDYVAHLQVDRPGVYSGKLRVLGPSGPAEVDFTQPVVARRQFSAVALIGLPFAIVLGFLGVIWFRRSSARGSGRA